MTETLVIRLYSRVYIFSKRSGGEGSAEVEADYIAVLKAMDRPAVPRRAFVPAHIALRSF